MSSLHRTCTFVLAGLLAVATACSTSPTPVASPGGTPAATRATPAHGVPSAPSTATPGTASTAAPRPTRTAAPTATRTAAPSATPRPGRPTCSTAATNLTDAEVAGQLLMISVDSSGLTAANTATITDHRIGSVFLLQNSRAGVAGTRKLADAIHAIGGDSSHIMLAADQEGGQVQRLQGSGFDRIPTARTQAARSPSELEAAAAGWGRQLAAAGIDLDLAPVADVVPKDLEAINQPIGVLKRGYGPDPSTVGSHVVAFASGMGKAGRATSVKHFPGLGRVRGNTDFGSGVTDSTTTKTDAYLAPFKAAVDDGVPAVMISLAIYTKIDKQPAVFSHPIVTDLLRHELGFDGVIVSDDLGAAKQVANVRPGDRALRFIRAGGDLITVAGNSTASAMATAIAAEMTTNRAFAKTARTAAARVLVMKARYGLFPCRAK
jgi:beta-N-acetylhexosaminidase